MTGSLKSREKTRTESRQLRAIVLRAGQIYRYGCGSLCQCQSIDHSYSPVSENVVVAAHAERCNPACDALQFTTTGHGFLGLTFRLLAETEEKSSRLVVCTFEEYDAGCVNLFLQEFVEIWDFEGGFGEKCVNERHILQDWACQKSSKTLEKVRISRVYRQEI